MGIPTESRSQYTAFYRTGKETVLITYAEGRPCGIGEGYSQWRVPRDTVESILVTPTQPLRISDLGIDLSKYDKRQGGHLKDAVYYINEQTGESLTVSMDKVLRISYFPGTLDKDLKCSGLPAGPDLDCKGLVPPAFNSYKNVSVQRERSLLDNFSIALLDEPNRTGYIIAYAGKRARPGEAKARSERAKKYLVETRGFDLNRLKAIDGGYRVEAEVQLYIVPEGNCAPTATPTVDPRDVKVVNAARRTPQRRG